MDSDNNGTIDKQEFMSYIKELDGFQEIVDELKKKGSTKENMDRVWDLVDSDGNGSCAFNEFLLLCLDLEKLATRDSLHELL